MEVKENNMKASFIGGTIAKNQENCKLSTIIRLISLQFSNIWNYYNGCTLENLPKNISGDLVLWMPDIDNEEEKNYPIKENGSVLICSKVMRPGYKRFDAVSRIFKMHGNAVIEIYKESPAYRFCLVDALANEWCNTTNITELCNVIKDFYNFTKSANRVRTKQGDKISNENVNDILEENKEGLSCLIDTNKKLQVHIMEQCGNRFFGNISTRCQKLFPSKRIDDHNYMFVSPRNTDKNSLEYTDMVLYDIENNEYYGNKKASVDSPCQSLLYKSYKKINYMIHGHATIVSDEVIDTKNYRLCGDINEVDEIKRVANIDENAFIINLKKHGFLIMADSLKTLNKLVDKIINKATIIIK